ncbi:hypothetical protein MY11210_001370 [Beauveria gryllotalpidicola]
MKSPIILATLFAGSLAVVPQPGADLPRHCMVAEAAIQAAIKVGRPLLPDSPYVDDAIKEGAAIFRNRIGCGSPPPEPKAPPESEQIDCSGKVDNAIEVSSKVLRKGFDLCAPIGYSKGLADGIKGFKTTLGCKEQKKAAVVADVEPPQCEPEVGQ